MDEKEFERLAAQALEKLEAALRDVDEALDVDLADGILTIEFDDGPRFVVNSHAAARQIWLAAQFGASHFSYDERTGRWLDTKTGAELWDRIAGLVSDQLGRAVALRR